MELSTDGAYLTTTHKGGGEGIVRDHSEKMIVAFATPIDAQSALEAELMAFYHGLIPATDLNQPIWIESDAEQAIKLFNGTAWGPAHICRVMARLHSLKQRHTVRATFIHREGNKAADLLAKMGLEQHSFRQISAHNAPRLLQAIVRLEEKGTPNIRLRDEDR
ncbi:uncharacterized protein LOC121754519 [Salvia splendens]|uniref:uncharacterized protein LOC121754519 n=1 Tax=Salvia splendens TaxID=180675 RepID=UPI001C27056E|nr:uncharacterized protein LOC121754519 [Salvia splendens]